MATQIIRKTKRLANVCVASALTHRCGVVCLGLASWLSSGNSTGTLEIEVVIPNSSKNRAHGIRPARGTINPDSYGFGLRFCCEVYLDLLPPTGAWSERRRRCQ